MILGNSIFYVRGTMAARVLILGLSLDRDFGALRLGVIPADVGARAHDQRQEQKLVALTLNPLNPKLGWSLGCLNIFLIGFIGFRV